jgi:hypothetical protein
MQGIPVFFATQGLLISNGLTPPVYEAWCGITQFTRTINKNIGTVDMPDCNNPDLPSWMIAYLISNQMVVSGSGTSEEKSLRKFDEWAVSGEERSVRWYRNLSADDGGGYYVGPALISAFEETGTQRAPWAFSFGITFSGKPEWVAAA